MSNGKNKGMEIPLERTGGRALLKEGVYRLRIEGVEERMGPSGSPYLSLTLSVIGSNGRPTESKIWDNLSFAPKARFKVDQILDALEAPEEGTVTPRYFLGKLLYATLGTDSYQGTLKNVVKQYLPPGKAVEMLEKQAEEDGLEYTPPPDSPLVSFEDEEDDEESIVSNAPDELEEEDIPF